MKCTSSAYWGHEKVGPSIYKGITDSQINSLLSFVCGQINSQTRQDGNMIFFLLNNMIET
jgi:hypothetical protein